MHFFCDICIAIKIKLLFSFIIYIEILSHPFMYDEASYDKENRVYKRWSGIRESNGR